MTTRITTVKNGDALRGLLLRLEFALEGDEVAFGQLHFFGDLFCICATRHAHVAHGRLDGEDEAALAVFAEDDVRALCLAHVGDE